MEELESHLREDIVRWTQTGLSEQEAFLVATSRLGDPVELSEEFAEADASTLWRHRLYWMAAGVFAWFAAGWLTDLFVATTTGLAVGLGVQSGTVLGLSSFGARVLTLIAVVWCASYVYHHGIPTGTSRWSRFLSTRGRATACLLGLVLLATFGTLLSFLTSIFTAHALPRDAMYSLAIIDQSAHILGMLVPIMIIVFLILETRRRTEFPSINAG